MASPPGAYPRSFPMFWLALLFFLRLPGCRENTFCFCMQSITPPFQNLFIGAILELHRFYDRTCGEALPPHYPPFSPILPFSVIFAFSTSSFSDPNGPHLYRCFFPSSFSAEVEQRVSVITALISFSPRFSWVDAVVPLSCDHSFPLFLSLSFFLINRRSSLLRATHCIC